MNKDNLKVGDYIQIILLIVFFGDAFFNIYISTINFNVDIDYGGNLPISILDFKDNFLFDDEKIYNIQY